MGNRVRIAVMSDSHDRHLAVSRALQIAEKHAVSLILHCGDIESVATVVQFPHHTHFVFGNCDYDLAGLRRAMAESGATLHEPFGHLEVAGKSLAFVHGDDSRLLRELSAGGFDYVFHGHTHVAKDEQVGTTRIINPGALHRVKTKTMVILEPATGGLEFVEVD